MRGTLLPADPIFILGISPRSGTNFLRDLLCLHPDCVSPGPIWEDYLIADADLLIKYADTVSQHWRLNSGVNGEKDMLYRCLGDGLSLFLTSQADGKGKNRKRIVTKTPSVRHLEYFFKLFPDAHLLILVRDGRAVVESGVKSFGGYYESWIRRWAEAAQTILWFQEEAKNTHFKHLIVRYEDIYNNSEDELRRILSFLELNTEVYNFETATNLPVRGSSELSMKKQGVAHWRPIEKTSDFNPLLRWGHWGRTLHERFNWLAGQYLVQLGYEEEKYSDHRLIWDTRNKVMDIVWLTGKSLGAARRRFI